MLSKDERDDFWNTFIVFDFGRFSTFIEISLEFIPWQLDLFKTFRYVSEDVTEDYLRIIKPYYDFIVKSQFSIFDTCLIDIEKRDELRISPNSFKLLNWMCLVIWLLDSDTHFRQYQLF